MKQSLFLLILFIFGSHYVVEAQKADSVRVFVHYKFSHVRDTNNRAKPYNENMVLALGTLSSVYKSYDRQMQRAALKRQLDQQAADQKGSSNMSFKVSNTGITTAIEFFAFPHEQKMIRKESLINAYLIEEPFPKQDWKISMDTTSFSGLHCQKATCHYKGRDYTAWFCADVPFQLGPWKLNGLPGIIVEAYDSRKEVIFKFDGIESVSPADHLSKHKSVDYGPGLKLLGVTAELENDPYLVQLPPSGIYASEKDFAQLKEAKKNDPVGFAKAALGSPGLNVGSGGGSGSTGSMQVKVATPTAVVFNNPIELPEKKS